jgi:hypothetical protein
MACVIAETVPRLGRAIQDPRNAAPVRNFSYFDPLFSRTQCLISVVTESEMLGPIGLRQTKDKLAPDVRRGPGCIFNNIQGGRSREKPRESLQASEWER